MIFPFLLAAQSNFVTELSAWRNENGAPIQYASSLEYQAKEDLEQIYRLDDFSDDKKVDDIVFSHAWKYNGLWYIYFVSHDPDKKSDKWVLGSLASTSEGRNLLMSGAWVTSSEFVKNVNNSTIKYTLVLLIDP